MKRGMLIGAVIGSLLSPPDAAAKASVAERKAMAHCDQHHVRACVRRAAIHRHVSYGWLVGVAYCESRLNPWAVNASSGATGTFQYLASTWARTPYAAHPRTSAKWSSLAAALMFSQGRSHEWSCA